MKWFHLRILAFVVFFLAGKNIKAQNNSSLTIEQCYEKAEQNFPMIKQLDLIDKTQAYTLDNISKGILPRINLSGQATYQSEVTALPIELPNNIDVPTISKDQYKLYAEVIQSLTEFGIVKQQKAIASAAVDVEKQKIDIELYHLKENVNQIYFGILLIDEQLIQTELIKKDLESGIEKLNVAVDNGIAIPTDVSVLKAEILQIQQRRIELYSKRNALIQMLSILINEQIDDQTTFEKPIAPTTNSSINRLELRLYEQQQNNLNLESKLIHQKNTPKLYAFIQGGFGRPALNFLDNDFKPYYIGGFKLNWNFNGYFTAKNEKNILTIKQESIDIQKNLFLYQTHLQLADQNEAVAKYDQLIKVDDDIISLREEIKEVAKVQLENGVITPIDFLNHINAADKARQNLVLHQMQLLQSQYDLKTSSGN
ncbi:MAG: TolC family protein [Bacteroidetes bacterium]|nr:TolC family protein [Bacteroidota bacterium]